MNVLVISTHTDDIELGAGGFVSKLRSQGHNVVGCIPTWQAFPFTIEEMRLAWKVLGIGQIIRGNRFGARDMNRQELLDYLIEIRISVKPDLVITHGSKDFHQSHRMVHEESIRAFKHCSILGYSFPWNELTGPSNSYFVELSQEHVDKKMLALSCYRSQKNRPYFSEDYQLSLLKINGLKINTKYAETFEVIRLKA